MSKAHKPANWKAARHAANRTAERLGYRAEFTTGDVRRILRDALSNAATAVRSNKESANA